jgi:hypothetical protein
MRNWTRFALPHRYARAIWLGGAMILTVVIAACSSDDGDGVLSPTSIARAAGADSAKPRGDTAKPPRDTSKPPRDSTKPPRDTTKPPRDTIKPPPPDTIDTMPPLPEKVAVSGKVVGLVFIEPAPGVRDTMRLDPLAGIKVRIMRNIIVNGSSAQELAAELVTDANGAFKTSLKGGYYVVYAEPPANSIWNKSFSYLAATRPDVNVTVYLWKKTGG